MNDLKAKGPANAKRLTSFLRELDPAMVPPAPEASSSVASLFANAPKPTAKRKSGEARPPTPSKAPSNPIARLFASQAKRARLPSSPLLPRAAHTPRLTASSTGCASADAEGEL